MYKDEKKINLCFFLGGFYQNGGIGRVTSMLANEMTKSGKYNIMTLCFFDPHLPNIYPLDKEIDQVFFLDEKLSMSKVFLNNGVSHLRRVLIENDIDVIIACGALYFPIVTLACKGIATKSICWEHTNPYGNNDHKGQYFARRYGIKRSDLNVVLTKSALDIYRNKFNAKETVQIYNPIDKSVIENSGRYDLSSNRIISVGRLTYQKNFQEAIKIAEKVLPMFPNWHWDIYGKGEDYSELESMINSSGLERQFHLCGQVNNLYELYKNYSFMVMTSRYEGFPMTLLEGMGNSLPLISYDIPTGPNEVIDNGKNGYLISEGDSLGLANAIITLIKNTKIRAEMSLCSSEKCSHFLIEDVINEWDEAIHNVCKD